jgi:5-methylthioadenosine/S-adenosylhomocysteine deaminase
MKMFALAGKVRAMDPAIITPQQVLYSATRAGALAQGREDCGLMREGFRADLIVVDVDVPNMRPLHDPVNGLVYSADGKDVLLTMVDGEVVYRDGEYKTIDIEKTMAEAETATQNILAKL